MTRLVLAELRKLSTVRTTWALLAAAAGLAALTVVLVIATAEVAALDLGTELGVRSAIGGGAGAGNLLALVLGVLLATGEFRHGTVTAMLLAVPSRSRVTAAKAAAGLLAGLVVAAAAVTTTLAVGLPWMAAEGVTVSPADREVSLLILGAVTVTVLYAALGVGIGMLVANQVAAVTGSILAVLVVEPLILNYLPGLGRWLPGGAAAALARAPLPDLLPMWSGGLLFTAYTVAAVVGGMVLFQRRDVT